MNLLKSVVRVSVIIVSAMPICFLAAFLLVRGQEGRLEKRALVISKGMRIEEVVSVMGTPKYLGLIASKDIVEGANPNWTAEFLELRRTDNEYYKVCNYFVERCWFPFMKKMSGHLVISVYLSYPENKVVYVAEYAGME